MTLTIKDCSRFVTSFDRAGDCHTDWYDEWRVYDGDLEVDRSMTYAGALQYVIKAERAEARRVNVEARRRLVA
jgi:hypothetical protein